MSRIDNFLNNSREPIGWPPEFYRIGHVIATFSTNKREVRRESRVKPDLPSKVNRFFFKWTYGGKIDSPSNKTKLLLVSGISQGSRGHLWIPLCIKMKE